MPTTLSDHGRTSEKHGDIPYYYVFPTKMYFRSHQVMPDDVVTWCRDNCSGFYRIASYTHKSSKRNLNDPNKFDQKVVYVDKVYLQDSDDALLIKLTFDVQETEIKRPKIKRLKRK